MRKAPTTVDQAWLNGTRYENRHNSINAMALGLSLCIGGFIAGLYVAGSKPVPVQTPERVVGGVVPPVLTITDELTILRDALYAVESSSGTDKRMLTPGPAGELGPLQITDVFLDDANRIVGYRCWTSQDRLNLAKSTDMMEAVVLRYYPHGTIEQRSRLFRRGPSKSAQNDKHGDAYWAKIRKYL